MKEFRKKQKIFNRIMKFVVVASALFLFAYIGIEPYVVKWNITVAAILNYFSDILVVLNMIMVFSYYSKYGKSDSFLSNIEYELDDYGFYFSAREENDEISYISSMKNDFVKDGYKINTEVQSGDFEFDVTAFKNKEFFYVVNISDLTKNDVIAHIDAAVNDLTVQNLKRVGNAVVCFVTDRANDDAISISKMITPIGKKEKLKISVCIAEPQTRKCYFLGNMQSKCQQMIVNYVMRCSIPIEEKYKGDRHLPFQDELEKHMEDFNIKDFKNGTFFAH